MQIINLTEKEQLNNFISRQKQSQFLQSWQWGEFHKQVSNKVIKVGVEENNQLIAAALLIKKVLPISRNYFYCPRGPVIDSKITKDKIRIIVNFLFNQFKKIAREENVMFLRFEPAANIQHSTFSTQKTLDVQPSKTIILDLAKSETEILKSMQQKTRYNIRLAEKKGVKIIEAELKQFDKFWQLMGQTSQRDKFRLHGINYYKKMMDLGSDFIKLFFAQYKKKIIAANIVSFFGDTVTYIHGASANDNRNVMAPYLLQWYSIKLAKKLGYRYYDFYGIDEKAWPGVTRYKKGFAGDEKKYQGTFDLIFDSGWYSVYKMVRKVRRTF